MADESTATTTTGSSSLSGTDGTATTTATGTASTSTDTSKTSTATTGTTGTETKTETAKTEAAAEFSLTKYDFKDVKLPEGVQLDAALIEAVSPVLLGMKVSQEDANKLVDAQVKHIVAVEKQREADFKQFMADTVKNNQAAIKKEWAGSYDANLATAQKGIGRFVSPAMKAILDDTGLGSHPEFLKAFHEIGKMVTEDKPPNGQTPPGTRKSTPDVLYGTN